MLKNLLKKRDWLQHLSRRKLSPAYWVFLSGLIVIGDYLVGPDVTLSFFYIAPVVLATWFSGWRWGLLLGCSLPLTRIAFSFLWVSHPLILNMIFNAAIRIAALALFVAVVNREVQRQALLKEVKILRGLLPICSFCKKIRTGDESWVPLEEYMAEHSEAQFSHGFCPECIEKHYGVSSTLKK